MPKCESSPKNQHYKRGLLLYKNLCHRITVHQDAKHAVHKSSYIKTQPKTRGRAHPYFFCPSASRTTPPDARHQTSVPHRIILSAAPVGVMAGRTSR